MNLLNTLTASISTTSVMTSQPFVPALVKSTQPRRDRDFGVGYGKSSGYAAPRPYVADRGLRMFRCA